MTGLINYGGFELFYVNDPCKGTESGITYSSGHNGFVIEFHVQLQNTETPAHICSVYPHASALFANSSATLYVFHGASQIVGAGKADKVIQFDLAKQSAFIHYRLPSPDLVASMASHARISKEMHVHATVPLHDADLKSTRNKLMNIDLADLSIGFL